MHASTFINRLELCNHNGVFVSHNTPNNASPTFFKEWLTYPANSVIHARKNLLAIDSICKYYNIPLATLSVENNFTFDCAARDLSHSGIKANIEFADKMIQQLEGII